jgi:hypothetical protein
MSSYLLNRNGNYHFRIRVPSDLASFIPSVELVKSLKTKDKKEARYVALPYLQSVSKTFSLLRSGFITGEQAKDSINRVFDEQGPDTLSAPVITHDPK